MGKITFQGRSGVMRIYDGSGTPLPGGGVGTPYYVEIPFANMNFEGPAAKPRPIDPIVVTSEGYVHVPTGEDYEADFYQPLPISFSCLVDDTVNGFKLRDALCNMDLKTPWTVGGNRWYSTKGRGSVILPDGKFVGTQPFFDVKKVSVDMEFLWTDERAASNFGMKYEEVYVPPQNISIRESPDRIEMEINGMCYGDIEAISSFDDGIES